MFAGTPEAAVPALLALMSSAHQVIAVVTRPPARSGRGRTLIQSPVAAAAEELNLPILTPTSASDPEFLAQLVALAPDAAAIVAYGALLPPAILTVPTHGWINLHFSLLPAWRGAAPVYAAIRYGDELTGATTFRLEAGLDTGPVFGTVIESIHPSDTAGALLDRIAVSGAQLLVHTLDGIDNNSLVPVPQPFDGVSHVGKVSVADAEIDWCVPAFAIERLIRALTPEPGAWTTFRGQRLGVGTAQVLDGSAPELRPGELQISKREVLVGSSSGVLRLGFVQPQGKNVMGAADWARGVRPREGEAFASVQEKIAMRNETIESNEINEAN
nr:methionyl-tRNA formyltransferase [Nakamurella antarctica]